LNDRAAGAVVAENLFLINPWNRIFLNLQTMLIRLADNFNLRSAAVSQTSRSSVRLDAAADAKRTVALRARIYQATG
jgi:hypothetical protein